MATSIQLDTSKLDAIIRNLGGNVHETIKKVAFTIEGRAKINVRDMDAVDTGALMNGIGVSMKSGGDSGQASAEARRLNPDAEIVPLPVPTDEHTAYVGPTVGYAAEVHFGNSTMPARPYLQQAVTDVERQFAKMLGDAVVNK